MKKIFLFSLLLVSCFSATSFDYKLSKKKEISPNDSIILNNALCLFFKTDGNLYTQTMSQVYIKCDKKIIETVDSVDATPYKSYIYILEATKNESSIIFWETQYESMPITIAYYLFQNKFIKIGEFEVFKRYNNNETYKFPINEIEIKQVNNKIDFLFLEDINYKVGTVDEKIITANKIIYIFDIQTEKLMSEFWYKTAGTRALMGGDGMDIFAGFGAGFSIGALNHTGGQRNVPYDPEKGHLLEDVTSIGRRTFHGVPINFISVRLSFNSYLFSAIN